MTYESRNRKWRNANGNGGFTLLELLLALALTLVVAAALAASMYTAFKARTSTEENVEAVRATTVAGDMIAHELANCIAKSTETTTASTDSTDTTDSSTGSSARTLIGSFEGTADSIDCFITGPEPTANVQSDVREVIYLMESDPSTGKLNNGGNVLARRVTSNLLATQKTFQPDEVICRNVVGLHFSYFDGTDWLQTWDSAGEGGTLYPLPAEIEITLELAPLKKGGEVRRTVRYVPLSCFKPPLQTVPVVTYSVGTVKGL